MGLKFNPFLGGLDFTGSGGGGGGAAVLDPAGSTIVAAEALAAYQMVTVDGHIADSANLAHFGRVAGITLAAVLIGNVATIEIEGEVTNLAWSWSPNSKLFLNGTSLSTAAPTTGFAQMVAVARNANVIIVRIGPPVLL